MKSYTLITIALLCSLTMAGCSDNSRMNLRIQKIEGTDPGNANKTFIEADLIGSADSNCCAIQDAAKVELDLDAPGTLGPSLEAFITGYEIEYFYYDPADGQLKGPVSTLGVSISLRESITPSGLVTIEFPVATSAVKAWSVGVTCAGVPGFAGSSPVKRMIARITVRGEDLTGKKLSAQGSILLYLADYAPYPTAPTGTITPCVDGCFGQTPSQVLGSCL